MIDLQLVDKGQDYDTLNNSYIIFNCFCTVLYIVYHIVQKELSGIYQVNFYNYVEKRKEAVKKAVKEAKKNREW